MCRAPHADDLDERAKRVVLLTGPSYPATSGSATMAMTCAALLPASPPTAAMGTTPESSMLILAPSRPGCPECLPIGPDHVADLSA